VLESESLIQKSLSFIGETISFENGDTLAIPSFRTDVLVSQEVSVYRVEQQEFNFHASTKDIIDLEVTIDDTFTYSTRDYLFTFKLDNKPIPYLDGWSRLSVNLITKELL
jgi:hypothetical protein